MWRSLFRMATLYLATMRCWGTVFGVGLTWISASTCLMRIQVGPRRNILTLFYCFVDLSSLWGKWNKKSPLKKNFRGAVSRGLQWPRSLADQDCHHVTHWWLQVQCLSPLPCQSHCPRWLPCSSQSQHSRWPSCHSQSQHSKWPPNQGQLPRWPPCHS